MAGKGSKPRPFSVDTNTFDSNWETIFGNKKKQSVIEEVSAQIAEATLDETENRITDHSKEGQ